jgi:hypothetical protein
MLTVHHLGHSQSERIIWLCEELKIPYELIKHDRDPVTKLAPPSLRALHAIGAAPVIEDDGLVLLNRPPSSTTSSPSMAEAACGSAPITRISRAISTGSTSRTATCSR